MGLNGGSVATDSACVLINETILFCLAYLFLKIILYKAILSRDRRRFGDVMGHQEFMKNISLSLQSPYL
jgi:hypothetical protein